MNSRSRGPHGGKGGKPARPGARRSPGKGAAPAKGASRKPTRPADAVGAGTRDETPRTFRLGVIPGATPGKWIDAWKQRMPHVEIELIAISAQQQLQALRDVDAAIVRLPLEGPSTSSGTQVASSGTNDEFHVIRLYDEVPVVVASVESHLMAADELTVDDLAGEVLITPLDDVLGPLDLPTEPPQFSPLATTEDAIATAASGVGIVVVPMSLARAYQRKDADHRPLAGGPMSTVALAWLRDRTTPDVETFVGIVRGRTANSSR